MFMKKESIYSFLCQRLPRTIIELLLEYVHFDKRELPERIMIVWALNFKPSSLIYDVIEVQETEKNDKKS
jgi:hypothetical protein